MQLLYTNENRYLVLNIKNLLENAGIAVVLRNEFAGGAAGLLAPNETWLELWLVNDVDADTAWDIIAEATEPTTGEWQCRQCGEKNDPSFELCWQCQQTRPD